MSDMTVGKALKTATLTVLAIAGFFGLWGTMFILSLPFTSNIGLSIPVTLVISAVVIGIIITALTGKRSHTVLSKRQKIGAFVAFGVIVACSLPLIKIDVLLFLALLPTLIFTLLVVILGASKRKGA